MNYVEYYILKASGKMMPDQCLFIYSGVQEYAGINNPAMSWPVIRFLMEQFMLLRTSRWELVNNLSIDTIQHNNHFRQVMLPQITYQ